MAGTQNNYMPVWVVAETGYDIPHVKDGRLIVSASASKLPINSLGFYNVANNSYETINTNNASFDYVVKAYLEQATYNKILRQQANNTQQKLYADSTNTAQINSFADVFAKFNQTFNPLKAIPATIQGFAEGGVREAAKSWYDNSIFKAIAGAVGDTKNLIKDYTIDPFNNAKGTTVVKHPLLNNTLVNFGETIDYFTGANAVKGFIQEGPEGFKKSFGYGDGLRKQYDWNTGLLKAPVPIFGKISLIDLGLELLTDPTNLITWGSSAAIKTLGKESVADVFVKSVQESGLEFVDNGLTKSVKDVLKNYIQGQDNLVTALLKTDISTYVKNLDTQQAKTLVENIVKNSTAVTEAKNFNIITSLKSMRTGSDALQSVATKAVGLTSAPVAVYAPLLAVRKITPMAEPYVRSVVNRVLTNVDLDNTPHIELQNKLDTVAESYKTIGDVYADADKGIPNEVLRVTSRTLQEKAYKELEDIFLKNKSTDTVLKEADSWVKANGYTNLFEYRKALLEHPTVVPETLTAIHHKVSEQLNTLYNNAHLDVLNSFKEFLPTAVEEITNTAEANAVLDGLNRIVNTKSDIFPISDFITVDELTTIHNTLDNIIPYVEAKQIYDFTEDNIDLFKVDFDELTIHDANILVNNLKNETLIGLLGADSIKNAIDVVRAWDDEVAHNNIFNAVYRKLDDRLSVYHDSAKHILDTIPYNTADVEATNALIKNMFNRADIIETYIRAYEPAEDVHIIPDGIMAKMVSSNLSNPIPERLHDYAVEKGISTSKAMIDNTNDITTEILGVDTTQKLFNRTVEIQVALENTEIPTYLDALLDEWNDVGLSQGLGNSIKQELERIQSKIKEKMSDSAWANKVLKDANNIYNNLETILQYAAKEEHFTKTQLQSVLYLNKLAHIESMRQIFDTVGLTDVLQDIRSMRDVGTVIDILKRTVTEEDPVYSIINKLIIDAESFNIGKQLVEYIENNKVFSEEFKGALLDTVAGKQQGMTQIYSADRFAAQLTADAKEYIDRSNNKYDNLYEHLGITDRADTQNIVTALKEYTDQLNKKEYTGKDSSFLKEYLGKSDFINVPYAIAHTNYKTGSFYEISLLNPNGEIITIVNKDFAVNTITESASWKLYGMSRDDLVALRKTYTNRPNVVYTSNMEFPAKVKEVLQSIKDSGYTDKNNKKAVRLVGYNNGTDAFASDKILNDFFRANSLSLNLVYDNIPSTKGVLDMFTTDIGQQMRIISTGAAVVPNEYYTELSKILNTIKLELDSANTYYDTQNMSKISMMPDINTETLASLNSISLMLEEAISAKPRMLSKEQIKSLLSTVGKTKLSAAKYDIDSLRYSLSDTLNNISKANKDMASVIITRNGLYELTGTSNIMYMLRNMTEKPGILPIGAKKIYDPRIMKDWITDEITEKYTVLRAFNTVSKFEQRLNYISQPQLLTTIPMRKYADIIEDLRNRMFANMPNAADTYKELYNRLGVGRDQLHSYIIAKHYFDRVTSKMTVDEFKSFFDMMLKKYDDSPILYYLKMPDSTVYSRGSVYIPGINPLNSKLFQPDTELIETYNLRQEAEAIALRVNNLNDNMVITDRMQKTITKDYLPAEERKSVILKPFSEFVNYVHDTFKRIEGIYDFQLKDTEFDNFQATQEYTKSVKSVLDNVKDLGNLHAINRSMQVLQMPAEVYRNYLFKYSTGVQIIDMKANIFVQGTNAMINAMHKFTTMLDSDDAKALGLRYIIRDNTSELIVWLDKDIISKNKNVFEKVIKDFKIIPKTFEIPEDMRSDLFTYYHDLVNSIHKSFDPTYGLSMHTIMTKEKREALLNYIPNEIRGNIIDNAYVLDNKMLDGLFNHTVLGDYSSGAGYIYDTQSTNLLTNIGSGFNAMYNMANGISSFTSYIFNPDTSLKKYLQIAHMFGMNTDQSVIANAVKRNNRVVVVLENNKLRAVDISTKQGFKYAIDKDAALINYSFYNRAREIINSGKMSNKLLWYLNKNYLIPLKIGMLLSPSFIMRNIIDSSLKGTIQAGNIDYLTDMFRTQQIGAKFNTTLYTLYHETDGIINRKSIKAFFTRHADDAEQLNLLDENLFGRVFAFSNTSSATASRYNALRKDNLDNMYRYVAENEDITKDMVKKAIVIFDKLPETTVDAAQIELSKIYPPHIVKDLAPLVMYFKKQDDSWFETLMEMKYNPLRKVQEWSTSFEDFIRLHTFLYWSEYKGSSFSKGVQMTDLSQFNRTYDSTARKLLDTIMPFTSFAIDNLLYWADSVNARNNTIALLEDFSSVVYDPEKFNTEEMVRNQSLQWMLMQGNVLLDESTGLTLKTGNSMFNAIEFMADPYHTLASSWHVSKDVIETLVKAVNADTTEGIAAYEKDSYNNVKPISKWGLKDWTNDFIQLIPVLGTEWSRRTAAVEKYKWSDEILPLLMPGMFGITKLDSAGTTYESRPIGYDWYDQSEEYRNTHRFVYGISYVPSWKKHDPKTYVDTYSRLSAMGYTDSEIGQMLNDGWYVDYRTYILKNRNDYQVYGKKFYSKRTYAKRTYFNKARRTYARKPKAVRKVFFKTNYPNKVYPFRNNASMYPEEYRNTKYFGRRKLYKDLYAKYGASRMAMRLYSGANASAIKLARETMKLRQRQQYRRF